MDLQLKDKVALVSGSTAGIGLAIAMQLAGEGAETIVHGRSQQRVDAAMQTIRKAHPNARLRGVAADVGTAAGAETVAKAVSEVERQTIEHA